MKRFLHLKTSNVAILAENDDKSVLIKGQHIPKEIVTEGADWREMPEDDYEVIEYEKVQAGSKYSKDMTTGNYVGEMGEISQYIASLRAKITKVIRKEDGRIFSIGEYYTCCNGTFEIKYFTEFNNTLWVNSLNPQESTSLHLLT